MPGATVVRLELPGMPESATEIRRKAANGEDYWQVPQEAGGLSPKHEGQVPSTAHDQASAQHFDSTQLSQLWSCAPRPHFGEVQKASFPQRFAQALSQMQFSMATYFGRPFTFCVVQVS